LYFIELINKSQLLICTNTCQDTHDTL